MNATTQNVFVQALSLPVQERAALARVLLVSLESEAASPEIEAAWAEEAMNRAKAFDAGELQERDGAEVMRNLVSCQ
jgi:hypothetical protein